MSGIGCARTARPVRPRITAGYRFLPWLSAGGFFSYANYQDNGESDATSQLQRVAWQLGAYVRLYGVNDSDKHGGFPYLPGSIFSRLQPWVELGVGYTEDTSSYILGQGQASGTGGAAATQDYYLTYEGIVTDLRVGLRLAPGSDLLGGAGHRLRPGVRPERVRRLRGPDRHERGLFAAPRAIGEHLLRRIQGRAGHDQRLRRLLRRHLRSK